MRFPGVMAHVLSHDPSRAPSHAPSIRAVPFDHAWPSGLSAELLTDRQRQVIYLRYQADLAFDEIGAVLGISASAARSHCTFGLSALRKRLHDEVPR